MVEIVGVEILIEFKDDYYIFSMVLNSSKNYFMVWVIYFIFGLIGNFKGVEIFFWIVVNIVEI